jgi:uncharacterized DUF497 family protein
MDELDLAEGFDWDAGNRDKNWSGHKVKSTECEMVFFNQPLVILADEKHSGSESRYYAFGKTDLDRTLLIVFCLRKNRIRVISARDMNKKERRFYENQ